MPWNGQLGELTFPLASGLHPIPMGFRPLMLCWFWDVLEPEDWDLLGEF